MRRIVFFILLLVGGCTTTPIDPSAPQSEQNPPPQRTVDKPRSMEWCVSVLLDQSANPSERAEAIRSVARLSLDEQRVAHPGLVLCAQESWPGGTDALRTLVLIEDVPRFSQRIEWADAMMRTAAVWAELPNAGSRIEILMLGDHRMERLALEIVRLWVDKDPGPNGAGALHGLDEPVRLATAQGLVEASKRDSIAARSLIRDLEALAPTHKEFIPQLEYAIFRGAQESQAWDAVSALHRQAPAGKLMSMAVPTLVWLYASGMREHDREIVAMLQRLPPEARREAVRRAISWVNQGRVEHLDLVEALPGEAKSESESLLKIVSGNMGTRFNVRAVEVMKAAWTDDAEVRRTMQVLLEDSREEMRNAAARFLGTDVAMRQARLRTVVEDLRAREPNTRTRGALVWSEMASKEDVPVAAALVKAVREGDFGVREGIVAAIETSLKTGRPVSEKLRAMADQKGDEGAYARVAARAVK